MSGDQVTTTPTPTRGVQVLLDRPRYFRFSLGTLRRLREQFGEELESGVSGEKLALVLWEGLRGDDPSLTVEQVEELIDLQNLTPVLAAMREAMGQKATVALVGPPAPLPVDETAAASA